MKNLLKNNFRYILKNKVTVTSIFILLSIVVMVFGAFVNLSSKINNVYGNLVKNYNLHNLVINENYSKNPILANEQKQSFEQEIKKLGIEFREFNSLNVNNTEKNELIKIVEYLSTYTIDRLNVFEQYGLPKNLYFGNYVLPNSIDINNIIKEASQNIDQQTTTQQNVLARQKIVYFMTKANFNLDKFNQESLEVWNYIKVNNGYDPIFPDANAPQSLKNVSKYLLSFLDPTNIKYLPPIVRGGKLIITLTEFNNGIPITGYFEDPFSYLAIVSNAYVTSNNKKVYSFEQYKKDILAANSEITTKQNNNNLDFFPSNVSEFPNIKSTLDITNWLNNVHDDYKIYINSIPYLIVGSGITPDFIYPILSFENSIPDPKKEAILYANRNGYLRGEGSFESSPHEDFLLAKYNGPLSKNEILEKVNILAHKYMAWPSNITPAYWYNDTSNQLSPTALRIEFINNVIYIFMGVVTTLTIFVLVLVVFAMALFVKRFIANNKLNIGISISNGISKNKILFSLSFITTFICFIAGPIGLGLANILQINIFKFLSGYWFLPTPIGNFHFWWYFFIISIPMLFFMLLIFGIGHWFLKDPVTTIMKNDIGLKINKPYMLYSKLIGKTTILYKFKSSIVFGSLTKIIFLTILCTLSISSVTLAFSSANKLSAAYNLETQTNKSKYAIDLFTPTNQGGQYLGTSIQDAGRQFIAADNSVIVGDNYKTGFYSMLYKNSPLIRNYSALFLASADDSAMQKNDIIYIKNKVGNQILLNYYFGLGTLGTNPWNISKAFLPINQTNMSNEITKKLLQKLLTDNRPYNQAYFNNLDSVQPIIANDKNSILFPSKWVIKNFNQLDDPTNWKLNSDNWGDTLIEQSEIGVINASEIFEIKENQLSLRWLTPQDVIAEKSNLADILNQAYNTYGQSVTTEDIANDIRGKLYPKLYGNLFTQEAISDVKIVGDEVRFNVLFDTNIVKNLITTRSLFLKEFLTKTVITEANEFEIQNGDIILDPLDNSSFINREYGYKISNAISIFKMSDDYAKFIIKSYNDPAYLTYFYRLLNNSVIIDSTTDEPYVYINGTLNNYGDDIKIMGIKPNSKFISLVNLKNQLVNNKLENEIIDYIPMIVNQYTAEKYNLNIGSVIEVKTNNQTNRLEYANELDALNVLKIDSPKIQFRDQLTQKYKIVDINNTGNGDQFYISLTNAQKVLGLATQTDFVENNNITEIIDGNLKIGMNNKLNSDGGFNGIFTSLENPLMLSNTVGVYAASGLYPGSDSWNVSAESINLIKKTINNPDRITYLANALQLTVQQLQDLKTELESTNVSIDTLATRIINVLNYKYGSMAFNTIYENAISLNQQKLMFTKLSNTFDGIILAITALLICLAITMIVIISSMIINDLLKITAILTTLGYSNTRNASFFFSIFTPSWLFSVVLMIPINIGLNYLIHSFMFKSMSIFITIPFNWLAFGMTSLAFAIVFGFIFIWAIKWFKKNNIVDALKW